MQDDAEKNVGNYNEFRGRNTPVGLPKGIIDIQSEPQSTINDREIVNRGLELVNNKVNEILGNNNKLTRRDLVFPKIRFITTDPQNPNWAGAFFSGRNEIVLILDKINDDPLSKTKVFVHEYIHFLSHNGRDFNERVDDNFQVAQNNNVGFQRDFGLDIRSGKKGLMTNDYFLSFNEAVTEQLAIDILPRVHETYRDYRGLLNQVIDDAAVARLGAKNENGTFQVWSREQLKNYIYVCFFRGNLGGFTTLLKTVYKKYEISEQQFGLMTNRDDLPSVIENKLKTDKPETPPPPLSQVAIIVQQRINSKTPDDYITDIVGPKPDHDSNDAENTYGIEYDSYVKKNNILPYSKLTIGGKVYDVDNQGFYIYHSEDATQIFNYIKGELDNLLAGLKDRNITQAHITQRIDGLLFDKYRLSMLSEGFRDFYIYKHTKLADSR